MTGPAERQTLDPTSPWWGEHVSRYRWAAAQVRGKVVLDVACGTGFGVGVLSDSGASLVVGLDLDSEAVTCAVRGFGGRLAPFVVGDVTQLPFKGNTFDVVTTFETIEHISDSMSCLHEFRRILKEGGILFCSTPNRAISSPDGIIRNPYHIREFTAPEFRHVLSDVFGDVRVLGQKCSRDLTGPFLSRLIWRCLTLRGIRKIPLPLRIAVSQALTHAPPFPGPEEFVFLADPARAPTLLGICRKSGALAGTVGVRQNLDGGGV